MTETSSQPATIAESPTEAVLTALHFAMQDTVQTQDAHPPSDFTPRVRPTRSFSLHLHSPPRFHDLTIDIPKRTSGPRSNPLREFNKVLAVPSDGLPRSSIQFAETSTILHPSRFAQIVPFNISSLTPSSQTTLRHRRNTVSGATPSQIFRSQYTEVLIRKEATQSKLPPLEIDTIPESPSEADEPAPEADSSINPMEPASAGPSEDFSSSVADTNSSGPSIPQSLESANELPPSIVSEPNTAPSSKAEPVLYGLIYDDGLIDFVEHPLDDAVACEDVTTPDHSASPREATINPLENESEPEAVSSTA